MDRYQIITGFLISVLCVSASFGAGNQPYLQQGGGMYGTGQYAQGHWSVVKSVVVNPTDKAVTPLLTITSQRAGDLQFARRCWVPPHSKINIVSPFYPTNIKSKSKAIKIKATLVGGKGGQEFVLSSVPSLVIHSTGRNLTAIIGSGDAVRKLVSQLRTSSGWDKSSLSLRGDALPDHGQMLSLVGSIVLASPDIHANLLQVNALRDWVLQGGRIWIMLDGTHGGLAQRLLSDQWHIGVLDQTSFTDLKLQGPDSDVNIHTDYPLKMLRVTAPSTQVLCRVNGYPAVMSQKMGLGTVYMTTLEPTFFLKVLAENKEALGGLAKVFMPAGGMGITQAQSSGAVYSSLKGYASHMIGYTILGRTPVLVVLVVLIVVLIVIGLVLTKRRRLELAAGLAGLCAVIAAVVLVALGLQQQAKTPTTLSTAQLLQVSDSGQYSHMSLATAIYRPPGSQNKGVYVKGSETLPDIATFPQSSSVVRVIWLDNRTWRTQGLNLSSGAVHTLGVSSASVLSNPIVATAKFTADGISGQLQDGMLGDLQDAVLLAPSGAMAPQMLSEGQFTILNDASLPERIDKTGRRTGAYISSGVLSPTQISRQQVYQTLVNQKNLVTGPVLLGWIQSATKKRNASSPIALSADARFQPSATVLVVPIHFEKSSPGDQVSVPAALMPVVPYRGENAPSNTIYDPRRHVWNPNINRPQTVIMQYAIPDAVKPLKLSQVTVSLGLLAPGRPFSIVTMRNGHIVTLFKGNSLVGEKTIVLKGNDLPAISKAGSVLVGLRVGSNGVGTRGSGWSVKRLEISVRGTVERSLGDFK